MTHSEDIQKTTANQEVRNSETWPAHNNTLYCQVAKTRKVDNSKYWQGHLEMRTLMRCRWMLRGCSSPEKQFAIFTEISLQLLYDPVISPEMQLRAMIVDFHKWTHFEDDCGSCVCCGGGEGNLRHPLLGEWVLCLLDCTKKQ